MKRVWFHAKRFGYGWYPSTWQGWLSLVVYFGLAIALIYRVSPDATGITVITQIVCPLFALTTGLLLLSYLTGETAHWNWSWIDADLSKKPKPEDRLKHKWIVIGVCLFFMIVFLALSVVGGPLGRELYADPYLASAAQCTQDSDCVSLGDRCDFGCSVTVNRSSEDAARNVVDFFDEGVCSMYCPDIHPACVSGMCESR